MPGYRACIIGCGRVAWMLEQDPLEQKPCTHMGGYEASGMVEVKAGADLSRERLDAFSRRYGVKSLFIDYREMMKAVRPDIVSIAAYAPQRREMVMSALDMGVKGIWCEKALAASLEEADEMVGACEERGATMIVSHMRRWSPEYRKVRELIHSGVIGDVLYASSHFSGSVVHTGTHAFDVLRWFLGEPEWVEAELEGSSGGFSWDQAHDPGARALIMFKDGVYASVHAQSRPYFFFEFEFVGTEGRMRIGNNEVFELHVQGPSRHYTGLMELRDAPLPPYEKKNIWVEAARNLVDCMEGRALNLSGPQDGRAALEMALAVHKSGAMAGRRVHMPLEDRRLMVQSR